VQDEEAIGGILRIIGVEKKIAIFQMAGVVGIGRSFHSRRVYGYAQKRHSLPLLFNLFKKWPGEIVVYSILKPVPIVRPPAFGAIYGIWRVGAVDGDKILFAKAARALIKIEEIQKRQPPLEPALRAPCRRGHLHLLVEIKILRLNSEILATVLAIFSFGIHIYTTSA